MSKKNGWVLKRLHLLLSVLIVVPVSVIYGVPLLLPKFLDIKVNTTDLSNLLKAIMGLYLGIATVWVTGIINSKYWKTATQLNIIFMLTLAAGRALSMLTDGLPTAGFVFGIIAELIIGLFSIYQLKKYSLK